MPKMDPAVLLRSALAPAERLEWSAIAGPVAAGGVERLFGLVFAGALAVVVTALAGVEGLLPALALPVLFIAVFLLSWLASSALTRRAGTRPRAYGISDRRVLVHVDGAVQSSGPGELATLEVDRQPDGSVDLFWGWKKPVNLDRRPGDSEGANPMKFHVRRRTELIGFIGLDSEEPAPRIHIARRIESVGRLGGPSAPGWPRARTRRQPSRQGVFSFSCTCPAASS